MPVSLLIPKRCQGLLKLLFRIFREISNKIDTNIFPQRLPEYGSERQLPSHRTHGHHLAQPRSQGPFSTSRTSRESSFYRERTLGTRGCTWLLDVRATGRPGLFSLPNQDGGPGTRSLLHYKTGF